MNRWIALCCSALACAACRSKPTPPSAEPAAKSSASAAPVPSSAPTPSGTEASAPPVDRPKASLGLKLALTEFPPEYQSNYGRGVFNLHSVRGAVLVTLGEALYVLEEGKLVEIPMGVGEQQLGSMKIGPLYAEIDSVAGRYPDELWVNASGMWVSDGARIHSAWSGTYRQRGGEWVEVGSSQAGYAAGNIVGWSGGRSIGWGAAGFEILGGSKKSLPIQTPGKSGVARVAIDALAGLPSGDLYALGSDAENGGAFSIEHWTDADDKAVGVHELPSWFCTGPGTVTDQWHERVGLYAASPQAVFAICQSKLEAGVLRFDGKDLTVLTPPAMGEVEGAAAGGDGSLWIVTASSAYVLGPQGSWRELAVPSAASLKSTVVEGFMKPEGALRLELSSVAVRNESHGLIAGSLYDASSNAQSTFLFTSDDTKLELPKSNQKSPTPTPSSSAAPSSAGSSAEGGPLTADCKTPFVVLYSVSDSAPADYAYPATRDALASASPKPRAEFVEFRFKQHRTLGAKVPTVEQARSLTELITARVKGSKPAALCLDPTPALIRELKL
jgi:hypothetical protein